MQIPPLAVLQSYPAPNYVNPETKGAALLICNSIMFSVSSVVVGIRVYTRVRLSRNFGADDVFILLAMGWALGMASLAALSFAELGGTRHVWDVQPSKIPTILKFALASGLLFSMAVSFVKISMLLLTRKIMGNGNKIMRNIIIFAIAVVAAGNVIFVIVTIFQCKPISAQWTLSFKPQDCINIHAHVLAASIINNMTGFFVVLIPIPVFLKLDLERRQRAIVLTLFSAGFMVCIVGIVRAIYWHILSKDSTDITWDLYPVYLSGTVELHVGIICASLPATRAFFTLHTPKFLPVTSESELERKPHYASNSRAHPYQILGGDAEKSTSVLNRSRPDTVTRPSMAMATNSHSERIAPVRETTGTSAQISIGVDLNKSLPTLVISTVRFNEEKMPKAWWGRRDSRR